MICRKCGTQNSQDSNFCSNCGITLTIVSRISKRGFASMDKVSKKHQLIFLCAGIIIFLFLFYQAVSFFGSLQFKLSTPTRNTAGSVQALVTSLLRNEEFFSGDISVRYIGRDNNGIQNKVQIKVLNTSTGDDSIGAVEYIVIAEKKGKNWRITDYKSHWKCTRDIVFQFWTTSACI